MMDKEAPPVPNTNIPPDAAPGQVTKKPPLPAFSPIPLVKTMIFPDGVAKPRHIPSAPLKDIDNSLDSSDNGYNAKVLHFQGVPGEKVEQQVKPAIQIRTVHSLKDEQQQTSFDPNAPRVDINGRVLSLQGVEGEEENTGPAKYVKIRPIRSLSDMQNEEESADGEKPSKNLLDINAKVQAALVTPKKDVNPFALQKAIRTFKTDVAETAQGMSVADIAIAENSEASEVARLGTKNYVRPKERHIFKNFLYFILSIGLIGGGGFAAYYFYMNSPLSQPTVYDQQIPESRKVSGLLVPDEQEVISADNLTSESFADLVNQKKKAASTLKEKQILEIVFSTKKTGIETRLPVDTFFGLFGTRAPSLLYRSFEPEYMFGYVQHGTVRSPFMIFKTKQFQSTYAGMLGWERTIGQDMVATFEMQTPIIKTQSTPLPIAVTASVTSTTTPSTGTSTTSAMFGTSTASTTIAQATSTTTPPQSLTETVVGNPDLFVPITTSKDKVIRNKDTRIIYRIQGGEIIAYSLVDKDTLVITSGEVPLEMLIEKLDNQIYTR